MSTSSVRLPDSLQKKLNELAEKEGVSMNQFITPAVSKKISALLTVDYLKERAARGNRKTFEEKKYCLKFRMWNLGSTISCRSGK